jgi:hypothetical protein
MNVPVASARSFARRDRRTRNPTHNEVLNDRPGTGDADWKTRRTKISRSGRTIRPASPAGMASSAIVSGFTERD